MNRFAIPLVAVAALLVFLVMGLRHGDPRALPSPFIGKAAPEFTLPTLKNPEVTIGKEHLLEAVQYRRYCETLTAMDRDIERLLNVLDDLGLTDNTLVCYAGDNGMLWGEHRCHGIREPYEDSIRLPMIVRGPGWIQDRSKIFLWVV